MEGQIKLIKIMYLTHQQEELDLAMEYGRKIGVYLYPTALPELELEYVRQYVEIAVREEMDVITAKGRLLFFLDQMECSIPVIPSGTYGEEIIKILWEIRQDINSLEKADSGKDRKVAVLTHQPLYLNAEMYSAIFGFHIETIQTRSRDRAESEKIFFELKAQNFDYVVCSSNFREIAENMGINTYYIYRTTAPEMIERDLDIAKIVAEALSGYKRVSKELRTLVDYAFESIVTVDREGTICILNQTAEMMFQCEEQSVIGQKIWDVIPELPQSEMDDVLNQGEQHYGQIMERNSHIYVVNITPLKEGKETSGAVFHFIESRQIEQIEGKIKGQYNKKEYTTRYTFSDIIGNSAEMEETKRLAAQFARYNSNILIVGESGTGKELFAQSIHQASLRRDQPFVALNCGAIPENLLESELFGYVDGAFTGALKKGKKGLVETANHGTLFLDEISELTLSGQVQLLRVLEERKIRRVGDDKEIPVDIRVIAASNKNLPELIEQKKFREDLYYRLNVLTLYIPPLRERESDIRELTHFFLRYFGESMDKNVCLSGKAEDAICQCQWNGNVRQLKNFCERLVIIANQPKLGEEFVQRQLRDVYLQQIRGDERSESSEESREEEVYEKANQMYHDSDSPLLTNEKETVIYALNQSGGNRARAAKLLGISTTTLWRKMKQYQIRGKY